jgi:hypothetical protein
MREGSWEWWQLRSDPSGSVGQRGDDVCVEAVGIALIGVLGALFGVIVTEAARRRRDAEAAKAQVRSAARMVSAEMGMSAISIDSATTSGAWMLASLPTTGWTEHGAQLATVMTDDDFYAVVDAASKVAAVRAVAELVRLDPAAAIAQVTGLADVPFGELAEACRRAQEVLSPLAYPSG